MKSRGLRAPKISPQPLIGSVKQRPLFLPYTNRNLVAVTNWLNRTELHGMASLSFPRINHRHYSNGSAAATSPPHISNLPPTHFSVSLGRDQLLIHSSTFRSQKFDRRKVAVFISSFPLTVPGTKKWVGGWGIREDEEKLVVCLQQSTANPLGQ